MSRRASLIYKDASFNTTRSFSVAKVPSGNKASIYPEKGNIMYNIPDEVANQNGIMYYGDGTSWVKIASTADMSLTSLDVGAGNLVPGSPQPGPAFTLKGIAAGNAGISISNNGTDVLISGTGADVTLSSAGGTQTLVNHSPGPALAIAGLSASAGITLTPDAVPPTNVTIGTSIALTSAGGTQTLVNHGTVPNLEVAGLTAGNGILITPDASPPTNITIANSAPTIHVQQVSAVGAGSFGIPANTRYGYAMATAGGGGGGAGGRFRCCRRG